MTAQIWEVIGGTEHGGIIVRAGRDTSSSQKEQRLSTGALVEELEVRGDRLRFKLLTGDGPDSGWVSTRLKDKDLLAKTEKSQAAMVKKAARDVEALGRAQAAKGPGPHNGPTIAQLVTWLEEQHENDRPDLEKQVIPVVPDAPCPAASANILSSEEPTSSSIIPHPNPRPGWLSVFHMERVANFRDAAGIDPNSSWQCYGGCLRRGLLFRTGQWNSATHEDLTRIRDELGILTYIDLRTGESYEGGEAPCYDVYPPCPSGRHKDLALRKPGERRRVHCPLTKNFKLRPWTAEEKALSIPPKDSKQMCSWWHQQVLRDQTYQKGSNLVLQLCCTMRAILLMNQDEILKALLVLSEPANYPVAYGCMAGKDRTGLLGQLVLSALGVRQEDILADYMATNDASAHIDACIQISSSMWFAERKQKEQQQKDPATPDGVNVDTKLKVPLWEDPNLVVSAANLAASRVYREIMRYTFHVLDTEFGGVVNYLALVGFGPDHLERMRHVLVRPCNDSPVG